MRVLTQAAGVLALTVLGASIALFIQSKGLIPSKPVTPMQVTGDPPVTVSDGSLHAHSENGWKKNTSGGDKSIEPNPQSGSGTGQLVPTCLMQDSHGNAALANLWADDKNYDILPGATVTIVHDSADASSSPHAAEVSIAVPSAPGTPLTFTTVEGNFGQDNGAKGGKHNRQHSRQGEVESITIQNPSGAATTWFPVNYKNPHFTLEFCYK